VIVTGALAAAAGAGGAASAVAGRTTAVRTSASNQKRLTERSVFMTNSRLYKCFLARRDARRRIEW